MDELRKFSAIPRQRLCMLNTRSSTVTVSRQEGRAVFGGADPCGTRFCPNCGPQIQAERREEIGAAVDGGRAKGMTVLFLTLTLGHSADDTLRDLLEALFTCWRALTRGGWWNRTRKRHGLAYFVRVFEVQEGGANGWHPHVHVLLFLDPAAARDLSVPALEADLIATWTAAVGAAGFRATAAAQRLLEPSGHHLDAMAGYFTKTLGDDMAWELTGSASKRGQGSRNPDELLAAAVDGDEQARAHWIELEESTRGRQLIAFSAHMRAELALPEHRQQADIPVRVPEQPDALVVVRAEQWEDVAARFGERDALREVVESGATAEELLWWMHDRGWTTATLARAGEPWVPAPAEVGPPDRPWLAWP